MDAAPGKFELAHNGTLFLDEVAELSARAQVCLLRAIQERQIARVGGKKVISVDVRIIVASNMDLAAQIREGKFRADLYYRLNAVRLTIPPLRDRASDIPFIARHYLDLFCSKAGHAPRRISEAFMERLKRYSWPGNIRELQHVLLQAFVLEDGPVLMGHTFRPDQQPAPRIEQPKARVNREALGAWENQLQAALARANGNKSAAARALGVSRKTIYEWLAAMNGQKN